MTVAPDSDVYVEVKSEAGHFFRWAKPGGHLEQTLMPHMKVMIGTQTEVIIICVQCQTMCQAQSFTSPWAKCNQIN